MMMAVLLFMFQFSQIIKENGSDSDINEYAMEEALQNAPGWQGVVTLGDIAQGDSTGQGSTGQDHAAQSGVTQGRYVVFFGRREDAVCRVVEQWCLYTKRNLAVYENPGDYTAVEGQLPDAVLIDSTGVDLRERENLQVFFQLTDLGVTEIFCNLPEAELMAEETELCALLGIQRVLMEQVQVEGFHLFADFLLGGEIWYMEDPEEERKQQDFELEIPWYLVGGGTKTYMVGIMEKLLKDVEERNEFFPPLIWRNSYGQSKVFVVNGDFLSDMTGLGLLSAMMYEANTYAIYPVVNAQNVIVTSFPSLAGENDEVMVELYSRQTDVVQRDICWPSLSTLVEKNRLKLTCMFAPQYNYLDDREPSGETIPFYLQLLKEVSGEAGFSLTYGEGITLAEKLERDEAFYASQNSRYLYSAAFVDEKDEEALGEALAQAQLLENIRTVASDYNRTASVLSWYQIPESGEYITWQNVTSDADTHTFLDDFFVRSIETALGYSNVRIDMHDMLWPQSKENQWENMYNSIAGNLNTYWKGFSTFAKTTLTESDRKVRTFLNLDYRDEREGDCVYLEASGAEECWFVLRVHGEEITSISGADYQEIEKGSYLLHVTQERVEIHLAKNRGLLRYPLP